ncbi:M24 family metallopeptidase [Desmospora activa]|uniref:Xaa-Pro dipeptidase n=1 Tax=Desmospora activa DSM 45169 TaxID=1121389 RepID=A0A2T4ZAX3_9BACL|nr:M24 family metallopeptidase [Desmospora activa]PTM59030.1 Xaa-Pro dipeptidase [Desmospora activa DSM 45169]
MNDLPFLLPEYVERLHRTKESMEAAGVEVLLLTDPANLYYLSGYDAWSFYVHQMLVVILEEEQPIWIGREQDANGARLTTWIHRDNIIPYPDDYVQSLQKHPMDFIADCLTQIGQADRRIGVEMDSYYFTAQAYERLKKGMPDARFQDCTLLVNRVRMVKSDQEIAYMLKAARIAEGAMQMALESIAPGVRECDVAANIFHAQVSGTPHFGGDYPAIVPLLPAGEKTSTPHLTWTDRTYKQGDTVLVELAGCYRRYHSPLARTAVIGAPSSLVRDLAEVVIEGLNTTLDAVKPGMTCEEVEWVWRSSIAKNGWLKESRMGYSVGLNYPPDWGEHTASFRPGDQTILQPNMTFHMIPGMWFDAYGVELSETFRVTENGCEVLADFPREVFQCPVDSGVYHPLGGSGA